MGKPLEGIRVADFTRLYAGPFCTMLLGDLGADVVKIEEPGGGDPIRAQGPPFHRGHGMSFLAANRNKRSVALDLRKPQGQETARALAGMADVVVENFSSRVMPNLGLHYEAFRAVNPRLVYCATYGFRARGPYGNKPAYDDVIQAAAGLASLQAFIAGEPRYVPTIVADKTSSLAVLSSVLAGLFERERSGLGQGI